MCFSAFKLATTLMRYNNLILPLHPLFIDRYESVSKQFKDSYWLFGLRSTFHSVATTPNSCAMIMVLAVGQLEHFFFEAVSTTKALQEMGLPKTNITEVASSLQVRKPMLSWTSWSRKLR